MIDIVWITVRHPSLSKAHPPVPERFFSRSWQFFCWLLTLVRQVIGTVLYPVQMVAAIPSLTVGNLSHYFVSMNELDKENASLKRQRTANADVLQQTAQLQSENNHLRQLLDARERLPVKSVLAEIIYDARDPSTRKVIVD